MRYPHGGGLTAPGRSRWEQVRLEAAEMFARDADARQVAQSLRQLMPAGNFDFLTNPLIASSFLSDFLDG